MSSLGDVMVVGLTGQTGAGKSTVSRVFVEGGFQLIDADQVCRKVQQKGSRCLADLLDFFPKEILQEDGELNRKVRNCIHRPQQTGNAQYHLLSLHYGRNSAANPDVYSTGKKTDSIGCSYAV